MPTNRQIDAFVRGEKLQSIRDWCVWIGLSAWGLVVLSIGPGIFTNPDIWASTGGFRFAGVAALTGGGLNWFVVPLLMCGSVFLVAAAMLAIYIKRRP